MGIANRLLCKCETSEEEEVGRATEGGRKPIRARFGAVLGALALAFALVATALTVIPAGQATFPGANGKIAWNAQVEVPPFGEIFVMDANGSNKTNLTNNAAHDSSPQFSPDGTKIAFVSLRDGDSDVYVMNADGTGVTQLTNSGTDTPTGWSPDGTKILFSSVRDGDAEIFVMNADGSDQTNLTNNATNESEAVFSPDGTKIAFVTDRDGNPVAPEVYVMNADGSNPVNLTNNAAPDRGPDWSPDGTKIVFNRFLGPHEELFVMNADGSNQTNLSNTPGATEVQAAWSPDGTKIAYVRVIPGDPKGSEIFVINADGSNPTNLTNSPPNDFQADWQPLPVPFAAFDAEAEIELGPLANDDEFEARGTFTLGGASNGIAPLTEYVKLQVGTFSTTIPAGSFVQDEEGSFKFEEVISGVALEAKILPLGGGSFEFKAEGEGADLTGAVNPVSVRLTVGDDGGATTVTAEFE